MIQTYRFNVTATNRRTGVPVEWREYLAGSNGEAVAQLRGECEVTECHGVYVHAWVVESFELLSGAVLNDSALYAMARAQVREMVIAVKRHAEKLTAARVAWADDDEHEARPIYHASREAQFPGEVIRAAALALMMRHVEIFAEEASGADSFTASAIIDGKEVAL